ncbi:hypothetical protein SprV_0501797900 [Sparganum proliferum]
MREARKSQVPRLLSVNHPPLPICWRFESVFCSRIGLVGHIRIHWVTNPTTSTSSSTPAPALNPALISRPIIPDNTVSARPPPSTDTIHPAPDPAPTTAASITTRTSRPPPTDGTTSLVPSPPTITTNIPTCSDVDSVHTCPHYDHLTHLPGPLLANPSHRDL